MSVKEKRRRNKQYVSHFKNGKHDLQQVQQIRILLERMRSISSTCVFNIIKNNDGDIELIASAEIPQQVRVATTFKEVQYPAGE